MAEMKLGENIRSLRKEKGIGQDVLAGQLGVTVQAVSKWETGGSMPDITLLPQIAQYFGVTMEELFYGKEEVLDEGAVDAAAVIEQPTENIEPELVIVSPIAENFSDESAAQEASETDTPPQWEQVPPRDESHQERPQYGWSDLENLGRTISDSVSEQFKKIKENVKSGRFDFHISGRDDLWTSENAVRDDLPDDQVLRVVQFIGNRMVSADEVTDEQPIRLNVENVRRIQLNVRIFGSASLTGGVGGSVTADGYVKCGGVGGSVTSDDYVECKSVGGSVTAGGGVKCGNVAGKITADGNGSGGSVMGSVSADGDVHCGHVTGPVRCEGNVYQTE